MRTRKLGGLQIQCLLSNETSKRFTNTTRATITGETATGFSVRKGDADIGFCVLGASVHRLRLLTNLGGFAACMRRDRLAAWAAGIGTWKLCDLHGFARRRDCPDLDPLVHGSRSRWFAYRLPTRVDLHIYEARKETWIQSFSEKYANVWDVALILHENCLSCANMQIHLFT